MRASFNGTVIAESDETVVVEGNHYFPAESLDMKYFVPSDKQTTCPWKGVASYYTVRVGDQESVSAAWYYPETKEAAKNITGRVAFWGAVKVE